MVQISTNVSTLSKYLTLSTKVLTAPMTEELDVKLPYDCYMLSALMFVQIANTIEEGSTNSTGETTIRLEVLRSSFILTLGTIYDKSTAIFSAIVVEL